MMRLPPSTRAAYWAPGHATLPSTWSLAVGSHVPSGRIQGPSRKAPPAGPKAVWQENTAPASAAAPRFPSPRGSDETTVVDVATGAGGAAVVVATEVVTAGSAAVDACGDDVEALVHATKAPATATAAARL